MKNNKGFTILELVIAMTIAIILGTLLINENIKLVNNKKFEDTEKLLFNVIDKVKIDKIPITFIKQGSDVIVNYGVNNIISSDKVNYVDEIYFNSNKLNLNEKLLLKSGKFSGVIYGEIIDSSGRVKKNGKLDKIELKYKNTLKFEIKYKNNKIEIKKWR